MHQLNSTLVTKVNLITASKIQRFVYINLYYIIAQRG